MLNLLQSRIPKLADLLTSEQMSRVCAQGKQVRFADGEVIRLRGDVTKVFYLVESGQVIAGSEGTDGSFITAGLMNPGEHFGEHTLLAGLPRLQNLRAIGATELLQFSERAFFKVYNDEPDFGRALLTIALRNIQSMMEFIDGQARWPLNVRVAHLLLSSLGEEPQENSHTVNCRQEDLAEILGVSRVAVSKALTALQKEGLVTMGYAVIELSNVKQLLDWLDSNYQLAPIKPLPDWQFRSKKLGSE